MRLLRDKATVARLRRAVTARCPEGRYKVRRRAAEGWTWIRGATSDLSGLLFAGFMLASPLLNKDMPVAAGAGFTALFLTTGLFAMRGWMIGALSVEADTSPLVYTPAPAALHEVVNESVRRRSVIGLLVRIFFAVVMITAVAAARGARDTGYAAAVAVCGSAAVLYLHLVSGMLLLSILPIRVPPGLLLIVFCACTALMLALVLTMKNAAQWLSSTGLLLGDYLPLSSVTAWAAGGDVPVRTILLTAAMSVLVWPVAKALFKRFHTYGADEAKILNNRVNAWDSEDEDADEDDEMLQAEQPGAGAEQYAAAVRRQGLSPGAEDESSTDDSGEPGTRAWLMSSEHLPVPGDAVPAPFRAVISARLRSVLDQPHLIDPERLFLPPHADETEWRVLLRRSIRMALIAGGISVLLPWSAPGFIALVLIALRPAGAYRNVPGEPAFDLVGMGPGPSVPLYAALPLNLEPAWRHCLAAARPGWITSVKFALIFPAIFSAATAAVALGIRALGMQPFTNIARAGSLEGWFVTALICLLTGYVVRTCVPSVFMGRVLRHARFIRWWIPARTFVTLVNIGVVAAGIVAAVLLVIALADLSRKSAVNCLILAPVFIAAAECARWFAGRMILWLQRRARLDFGR